MKAITVRQPWASLIAEGIKTIETRGREHPWRSAIGRTIAIHAAARRFDDEDGRGLLLGDWRASYSHETRTPMLYGRDTFFALPLGAVLATCTLVDVVPIYDRSSQTTDRHRRTCDRYQASVVDCLHEGDLPHQQGGLWLIGSRADGRGTPTPVEDQRSFGDFTPGRFALLLADVVKLPEPIPARGHQGLWTWDEHELAAPNYHP